MKIDKTQQDKCPTSVSCFNDARSLVYSFRFYLTEDHQERLSRIDVVGSFEKYLSREPLTYLSSLLTQLGQDYPEIQDIVEAYIKSDEEEGW